MESNPKNKRRNRNSKDLPSIDNFFVPGNKVAVVNQYKDKIERMFEIQLHFESPVEDGQWLVLQGDLGDRRNTKNYINAIIQPDESQQIKFPDETCSEFTNPERLEQIEKQTNAVIKPLMNIAEFEICGTELAVTLALSMMEDIAGQIQQRSKTNDHASSDNMYLSPTSAAERLQVSLQRALSDHSDGSINEYSKTSESVKRVLVECLEDEEIEDDLLFAEGKRRKSVPDLTGEVEMDTDGVTSDIKTESEVKVSPVGKLAERLTDTAISKNDKKEISPALSKQQEYLRNFGTTVGYKAEEVNEALNFVDEKTRPSDFLDILQNVSNGTMSKSDHANLNESDDDVIIIESTTLVDLTDSKNPVETVIDHTKELKTDSSDRNMDTSNAGTGAVGSSPYKRDLPDSYKERLIRDFFQEDQNSSVEELKKRNAERQKMLKQNFQQQQQGNIKDSCDGTKMSGNAMHQSAKKDQGAFVKPKGKAAKKAKQDNKAHDASKATQNQNNKHMACENRYQSDEEQTCVMRPWVPGDQNNCFITGQSGLNNTENQWKMPKRKKPPVANTLTAPMAEKKGHKQPSQSPNRGQMGFRNPQEPPKSPRGQSAGRGKPVQVVSPTTLAGATENRPLPPLPGQQNEGDLKYIVIDGSNVAVTHGKGSFSSKGIEIVVDYFKKRGHKGITVFLPRWRKQWDDIILNQLQDEGILTLTPSRKIEGKLYASYDDRFILRLAEEEDGIIVSNDNFRDIMDERANWKRLVHSSLLMYCFAGDHFMPPEDPLGRDGPTLDQFLRKKPLGDGLLPVPDHYQQPRGFDHQGAAGHQGHFSQLPHYGAQTEFQGYQNSGQGQRQSRQNVADGHNTEFLGQQGSTQSQGQRQNRQNVTDGFQRPQNQGQNQGRRWNNKGQGHFKGQGRQSEPRSDAESENLYQELKVIFPEDFQEDTIRNVLSNHPCDTDLTKLTNYCMSVLFPS